jgi:serine/threonine-protein kinase RsbT
VSNAIKHGGGGVMDLGLCDDGIELCVVDAGPGIPDIAQALRDGWSRGRDLMPCDSRREGLGKGLGTVARLMDEIEIRSTLGAGTSVRARKWL